MIAYQWTAKTVQQISADLHTTDSGLSETEAARRLRELGGNDTQASTVSLFSIFAKQYANFLMLLLAFGAGLSLFLGQTVDGLVILSILVINGVLGTFQEYRAQQTSLALRKHIPQRVSVRRDGVVKIIQRSQLVPGDVVVIQSGQIISADMRLIKNFGLIVDESSLTGESTGIVKHAEPLAVTPSAIHECSNILFSGTVSIAGGGEAIVFATGKQSEFGKIITLTHTSKKRSSFLEQIHLLSDFLFRATIIITALLFLILLIFKPGLHINSIFLFAVALAIAIVPEMLPLISTIALTKGSLSLVAHGVLIKRLSALEDLGGVSVICIDKTGTITKNILSVVSVIADDQAQCVRYGLLASAHLQDKDNLLAGSFDAALFAYAPAQQIQNFHDTHFVWQESFDPRYRWQFGVFVDSRGGFVAAVKGAPESIIERCQLSVAEKQAIMKRVSDLGSEGLRSMAVASGAVSSKKTYNEKDLKRLTFRGLITFEDPIKDTASQALSEARRIGLVVKVLTGDAPEVAAAVAHKIGISTTPQEIVTGAQFMNASDEEKNRLVRDSVIFARVTPTDKFEIIRRLAVRESVLFLGEGINDAPSLKVADVGMVVQEASDIAQESADIILTESDLLTIVKSVILGRQIMSNISRYILITLTGNFSGLYALSLLSIISPILPLLPSQVLLENILTDVPMIALVNDPAGQAELEKPIRTDIRQLGFQATILGFSAIFLQFLFYRLFAHLPADLFRTLWLTEIILFEFVLIVSLRSKDWFWRGARIPVTTALFFCAVLVFVLFLPFIAPINSWFHLVPYDLIYLIPIFATVFFGGLLVELPKRFFFRMQPFSLESVASGSFIKKFF
ncbi:MAG: hypothetical protein RIQ54_44 [Candidatus Parcubacteria bacterium]|jgi:Mg2+-importing ATPase